ncbi:hypothetical protein [Pseudoalteromonas sp. NC201]|uniref:hypothetical protein n=1 Tax=Pseudoalteromonas sp. NC201 TaxID=1514074 RepID=UPI000C7CBCCA|nr:hypothetical protein [Pseudoalteromonas sp. NC201]AUJ71907.1 hypothetical protein PNC201_18450 [Pseudoalteromonas sp. NC201]
MNKYLLVSSSVAAAVLTLTKVATAEASTRKMYDSELCYTCDASTAESFAKKYEPALTCYDSGGVFDRDYIQECYSDTKEVLIINANSKQKWLYKLWHTNQGGFSSDMELRSQILPVPNNASALADELIKFYNAWDQATTKVSQYYNLSSTQSTLDTYQANMQMASVNNCDNEGFTRAAKIAYDGRTRMTLQERTEAALIEEYGSLGGAFESSRMTQFGYTIGKGGVGFSGQVEYVPARRTIDIEFYDAINGNHRVVYNLDLSKGIRMDLNKDMTKFAGVSVRNLRENPASLNQVSNCVLETLNKYRKASVKSGGSQGSGGIDLPPATGRIPNRSYGNEYYQTCTWTFYDPWGEVLFEMEGMCP